MFYNFSDERDYDSSKCEKDEDNNICDTNDVIRTTAGQVREASPTAQSEIIILDRLPFGHWPLKRSLR